MKIIKDSWEEVTSECRQYKTDYRYRSILPINVRLISLYRHITSVDLCPTTHHILRLSAFTELLLSLGTASIILFTKIGYVVILYVRLSISLSHAWFVTD